MPEPNTIQMTLTGPYKGKTTLLNGHQFIKGVTVFTGTNVQIEGVSKYFTRSYQVKITTGEPEPEPEPVEDEDNEAVRVDDSDVISDEEIVEQQDDPEEPNPRQADIIAAVNGIEKTEWVDQQAKTPRPRVKDVSTLMEDPTVTVPEIIEVIEKWLS